MKISVIIPVYNVEEYLTQCIDSVIRQRYSNLEIILVNDGSTDGSGIICDEFAARDARVRVIHQGNSGVSSARNTGIKASTGQYVTFVDSDDWVDPEMYENMIKPVLDKPDTEIIMCDFITVKNNTAEKISASLRAGYYTKQDIINEIYPTLLVSEDLGRVPIVSTCNCLFRKALLLENNIFFDVNIKYAEDYLFMAAVLVHSDSYFYLKGQYYYNYRQYDQSRSKKYQPEWWSNFLALNDKLKNMLSDSKQYDFRRQLKLQLIHSSLFLTTAILCNAEINKEKKILLLKDLFYDRNLKAAFYNLPFNKQNLPLKVILYLVKYRMAAGYLIYRNIVSKIKSRA